jgi:ferredoxin-NADP reductase
MGAATSFFEKDACARRKRLAAPQGKGAPVVGEYPCEARYASSDHSMPFVEPEALDAKGNRYYRRKLLSREFLQDDLIKVTFELPESTSLQSLGFDVGLGDFVRVRPYSEEHKKLVENPVGGRAYSPVSLPNTIGEFSLIVKVYGRGGVSGLLSQISLGSEVLITNHAEHVFWTERQKGYFANERSLDVIKANTLPQCNVCLIAFGIGITEIAPVALSELRDPRVKTVTILWAVKRRKDTEWALDREDDETPDDLVRQLFNEYKHDIHNGRLQVKLVISQEVHPDCYHGRISQELLQEACQLHTAPRDSLCFLAVGTVAMIAFAYETLGQMGFDVVQKDSWCGNNLLYRKLSQDSRVADRAASPLLRDALERTPRANPNKDIDDLSLSVAGA